MITRHGKQVAAAVTALHHGLELVTGNSRYFERVPGLAIARATSEGQP